MNRLFLFRAGGTSINHVYMGSQRSAIKRFSSYCYAKRPSVYHKTSFTPVIFGFITSSIFVYYGLKATVESVSLDSTNDKGTINPSSIVSFEDAKGNLFVKPPTNSPPFPKKVILPGNDSKEIEYDLLGVGVRTVSFLSFHVYAVGIYIASKDKDLAHSILNISTSQLGFDDLEHALLDPIEGAKIVSHLLDHGICVDIRIVPVRNTDFSHLRDGFVRGVLAHPYYKKLTMYPAIPKNDPAHIKLIEELGEGVNDLKVAFSRKMSVPKHNILHLTHTSHGTMSIYYYNGKSELDPMTNKIDLGVVRSPNISKILMLHYLSGKTPASESARVNAVQGLINL